MVSIILISQIVVSTLATGPTYTPGVQVGQWATYGQISANWYHQSNVTVTIPPTISDLYAVNSTTITITTIQGPNITASRSRSYLNGTRTDILWTDVQTGGNLTNWIVAGNLTAGDETYPGSGIEFSTPVNGTYLGVQRTVNFLYMSQSNVQQVGNRTGIAKSVLSAYYDQASGLLVELHYTFELTIQTVRVAYGNADALIADSNIFGTTRTPDFYLYPSLVQIVAYPGSVGSTRVFAVSEYGFSGNISLSSIFIGPSQVLTTLTPSTIFVSASTPANATLTLNVPASVSPAAYSVNVTGTSHSLHHTINIPVQIINSNNRTGFYLTPYPAYLTVSQNSNATSLLTIGSLNFTGTVTLFALSSIPGLYATPSPSTVNLTPGNTEHSILTVSQTNAVPPGLYSLNVTGFASTGHYSTILTVQSLNTSNMYEPGVHPGDTVNYNVTTYWSTNLPTVPKPAYLNNYGNITSAQLAVLSVMGTNVKANLTWTFITTNNTGSRTNTLFGDVNSGVGTLSPWIIAGGLHAGDTITNSQSAPRINATITKAFAGSLHNVNLLNITQIFQVTIQGIAVPVNTQLVWYWDEPTGLLLEQRQSFDATYGPFSATASIDILATQTNESTNGPDFTISASPSSTSLQSGGSSSSTIKLTSINNFQATVVLSVTNIYCAATGCPHATLTPASVSLTANGTATSTMTFSATTAGIYDITVNATSNNITHSATVEFKVTSPDFALTVPTNLTIQSGKSDTVPIMISPENGFTSLVNLTSTAPDGMTAQLSQNSITGSGTVYFTITISNNLTPTQYTVTVKAVSGSLTHTKTITIDVTTPPVGTQSSSNLILGLNPELFYTLVGVTAALAVASVLLNRRARNSSRSAS